MTWVAVGVGGAALVGTLGGAAMQSDAAKGAAATQSNATKEGLAVGNNQFLLNRSDTAPYRGVGTSAINMLGDLSGLGTTTSKPKAYTDWSRADFQDAYKKLFLDRGVANPDAAWNNAEIDGRIGDLSNPDVIDYFNGLGLQKYGPQEAQAAGTGPADSPLTRKFSVSDFWNDPVVQLGYQSGLDLGTKALKNAAPLTTGLDSGAALKELTQFGTDYTGRTMAAPAQARFVADQGNQFNKFAAMAGIGQTGVATSATAGINTANNATNLIAGNANAQGAAKIAGANAFSGGLNSISNYWQQQQMLGQLKGGGGGYSSGGGTNGYNPNANYSWADLNAG